MNAAQLPGSPVASSTVSVPSSSANDSFSQRSSHQRIVTRSPNHMCAISCATTVARSRRRSSVTFDRNRKSSVNVTMPAFSIAPALKPGTKT